MRNFESLVRTKKNGMLYGKIILFWLREIATERETFILMQKNSERLVMQKYTSSEFVCWVKSVLLTFVSIFMCLFCDQLSVDFSSRWVQRSSVCPSTTQDRELLEVKHQPGRVSFVTHKFLLSLRMHPPIIIIHHNDVPFFVVTEMMDCILSGLVVTILLSCCARKKSSLHLTSRRKKVKHDPEGGHLLEDPIFFRFSCMIQGPQIRKIPYAAHPVVATEVTLRAAY